MGGVGAGLSKVGKFCFGCNSFTYDKCDALRIIVGSIFIAFKNVSSLCNHLAGTVGLLPSRAARVRKTSSLQNACTKSCAAKVIARSGLGRPKFTRIGRDIHGSCPGSGGHVPSFKPDRITRFAWIRRASS